MTKDMMGQDVLAMGYGVIPKLVMKDPDLTIEAKAIYAYIASYAGAGNTAFPSVDLICHDLNIGKERFQKHKKLLLEKGYLIIEQATTGGKFTNNRYVINRTIMSTEQATEAETPWSDFTAMEDQSMENSAQGNRVSNNNSVNINSLNNNNPKDLLDEDDEDFKLNLNKTAEKDSFAYWQEKWLRHFGDRPPFTRQVCEGLEQWVRRFGDPDVVAHAFVRAGR